ncbi:hypothetical protein D3C84_915000 [compost metagenome]
MIEANAAIPRSIPHHCMSVFTRSVLPLARIGKNRKNKEIYKRRFTSRPVSSEPLHNRLRPAQPKSDNNATHSKRWLFQTSSRCARADQASTIVGNHKSATRPC